MKNQADLFGYVSIASSGLLPSILGHLVLLRNGNEAIRHMESMYDEMPNEAQGSCSRCDRRVLIVTVVYTVVVSVVFPVWHSTGGSRELMERMMPMVSNASGVELYFWIVLLTYTTSSAYLGLSVYLVVQYTFLRYAEHVSSFSRLTLKRMATMKITHQELTALRRLYSLFNQNRLITNAKLGIIPFLWLASLFIYLTAGMTYMVTHPHMYGDILTILAIALCEVTSMTLLVMSVFVSAMATDKFQEVKTTLIQITQAITTGPSSLEKVRRSLVVDMLTQPVVPAMAWDMFPVDKQLVLKFTGSVVPFAVMMITTAVQQERAGYSPVTLETFSENGTVSDYDQAYK
ncbi:hypothetical protein HDE_12460 [Halotydeus destructor]|nr:hypothetical protein HDE_12460 [Halotydeus destructor]